MDNTNNDIINVIERLAIIETKLDNLNCLKNTVDNIQEDTNKNLQEITQLRGQIEQCRKDINTINDAHKWIIRTIAGSFITSAISMIFVVIKLSMHV